MRTKKDTQAIKSLLLEHYKDAKTELKFSNSFELLIAVMLSAQCTDKRVNLITPELFRAYPTPQALAAAKLSSLKLLINSCSFFNNKAENLIKMAKSLVSDFGGAVPMDEDSLKSLAGVGQKTAHVVLIEHERANLMAVDTHVFRLSHRLGLSSAKTPEATETELTKAFKTELGALHQAMVLHGRYTCKAISPQCQNCFLSQLCPLAKG